jgi:drug/metabolite transporter (DMT)-like permease
VTSVALALVLSSAVVHATWNLLAKRVGGGPATVWLFSALSATIYAPLGIAVILIERPTIGSIELLFIGGSGLLHLVYFVVLQQAYRVGDLSLIYPLARGTGPALSTTAAILFLGERPSPLAIAGALLVVGSVFVISGGGRVLTSSGNGTGKAVLFGVTTGVIIASYTLWDKYAVATLAIPPLVFDWGLGLTRAVILTPIGIRHRAAAAIVWREHRSAVLGIAILSPLAYILVLTALSTSPVSYVAPAREISILIAAILGARLLAEGDAHRRLTAASTMVLGVVALALG